MFGKKKDKKKESTKVEEKAAVVDKVEEKEIVPDEAKSSSKVTFRSSGHQKLYDRLDPKSKYAKNLVRRHAK